VPHLRRHRLTCPFVPGPPARHPTTGDTVTDQPARQRLIDAMRARTCFCGADSCQTPEPLLRAALDEHAHELAERIRAHIAATWPREFTSGETAADLIDPKAQR
jgi:hypothetical protein